MSKSRAILLLLLLLTLPGQSEPAGKVSISLAEFLKLQQSQTDGKVDGPPRGYLLSGATYTARPQERWVQITARATLEVKAATWQEVPLVSHQAVLSATRLNGNAVPVYQKEGKFTLLTREPGRHKLELIYQVPLEGKGLSQGFTFAPLDSPVGQVHLTLPADGLKLSATPPVPVERKGRSALLTIQGGPQNATRFQWERKSERPQAQQEARLRAQVHTTAQISETAVRCVSMIDYQIVGEVSGLELTLTPGVEVLGVEATGLSGWTTVDSSKGRQVLASFSTPASGDLTLKVVYEQPLESINSTWDLPTLGVLGARLSKGYVAITSSGAIEVQAASLNQAREIEPSALPPSLSSERVLSAIKYTAEPYQITLETSKGEEVTMLTASIDSARVKTLVTEDGKVVSVFTYQVRNNRKQYLEFQLPPGLQVWSAFVDGEATKPVETGKGGIKIALATSQNGSSFPLELICVGQAPVSFFLGSSEFQAPAVDVPISSLEWTVHWPRERSVWGFQTDMQRLSAPSILTSVDKEVPEQPAFAAGQSRRESVKDEEERDGDGRAKTAVTNAPAGSSNMAMLNLVQTTSQGSFPVRVRVPESGEPFAFQKLMVTNEMPTLRVRYYDSGVVYGLAWTAGLIFLAALIGAGRRRNRRQGEQQ